jgi:6-phosphofructokinase 1
MEHSQYAIESLGLCRYASPINLGTEPGDRLADFTLESSRVVVPLDLDEIRGYAARRQDPPSLELAGPREMIFFDPAALSAGIVTCGGLCPGLNDVIRALVMTLHYGYGVPHILGFRYGYAGLVPDKGYPVVSLTPEAVRDIHKAGGTVLGTSRGEQDVATMVDTLVRMGVGLIFAIGGDGTFRGALDLHEEVRRRGLEIGVVGIPKTIDNDIPLVDQTFGFLTAVAEASLAIQAAYFEACSVHNGIGLVKLMGRNSGFIAATAALANRNVNLVLVPEIPFDIEGDSGLVSYMERRFAANKSTVIVVAEGAGQEHMPGTGKKDASGNVKLADIGLFLKDLLTARFSSRRDFSFSLKYIDPSYMIRSAPARANDSIFCGYLAQAAAHAGMAGKTGMAVGRSHGRFTHIPLKALVSARKTLDPESELWLSVLQSTGQPFYLTNEPPKQLGRMSFTPQPEPDASGFLRPLKG